jgi:hypothetical protein
MKNEAPSKKIPSREGWREAPGWVVVCNPQPILGLAGPFPSQKGIHRYFLSRFRPRKQLSREAS